MLVKDGVVYFTGVQTLSIALYSVSLANQCQPVGMIEAPSLKASHYCWHLPTPNLEYSTSVNAMINSLVASSTSAR